MNPVIQTVTERIIERSKPTRHAYLEKMRATMENNPPKKRLSCGNLAHALAASSETEKLNLRRPANINLGIISAYNDMLSAHQPYANYPDLIKQHAAKSGATAQLASAVPAMCDGVTQGQAGMELSLFSRDVVAMATAIGLTHNMFDAALYLGICDKIVPGMMIGALKFGHLPAVFVPAGPMASGISNQEKAEQRQKFAQGEINREQMLDVELSAYHSAGTCTFYGTANSNQMLMELMGVQLPNSSFVHPESDLRACLTEAAVQAAVDNSKPGGTYRPLYTVVTERSLVNAVVGLLATGGSTNHCLHLIAIARAAGIILQLEDLDELSTAVPLLARVYPNGSADVNHFHAAGGIAFLVKQLRKQGYLNEDVSNILGEGLDAFVQSPQLTAEGHLHWKPVNSESGDENVLRPVERPFSEDGGLKLLGGNLGKAIIKNSAISEDRYFIEAPCQIFHSQDEFIAAFNRKELFKDVVAVLRFQGPSAIGMPELHKLTPLLGIVQDQGHKVALLTDGRMSGASGKVPAAIHCSPEAAKGGMLAKLQDGDIIRLDVIKGELNCLLSNEVLNSRPSAECIATENNLGRDLFDLFRANVSASEDGAAVF